MFQSRYGKRWRRSISLTRVWRARQAVVARKRFTENSRRDGRWPTAGKINADLWLSLHAHTEEGDKCSKGSTRAWRAVCESHSGEEGGCAEVDSERGEGSEGEESGGGVYGYSSGSGTEDGSGSEYGAGGESEASA